MKILVTGSSGHLGEALMRTLRAQGHNVTGIDIVPSGYTDIVGSIADRNCVRKIMPGINVVLHTATLHKPHVISHSRQEFVDVNITGTLNLLEEAVAAKVSSFVYTSTTSTFGDALTPAPGEPAAWITEKVVPIPKNIYGVTKVAAEDICQLFFRNHRLPCLVLKTSRFFPEEDDNEAIRVQYDDLNAKANEFLYRRVELEDVVSAHLLAIQKAKSIGFGKYIISATTPFGIKDLAGLAIDAPRVLKQKFPDYEEIYAQYGWKMFPVLDRVYVNEKARKELEWKPVYDFRYILDRLKSGPNFQTQLVKEIGMKGYHKSG